MAHRDDDLKLTLGDLDERFTDPDKAAEYLESVRWANGVVCPKCGESEREPYRLKNQKRRLWKCRACRKQFTVTVGTIFESSHIPLHKWLLAFYLLCASKKGMSAHQLHRMLGITYKSAWFVFHRVREAMSDPAFSARLGGIVEVDECYIGGKPRYKTGSRGGRPSRDDPQKVPVIALVERGGRVRSSAVANVTGAELKGAPRERGPQGADYDRPVPVLPRARQGVLLARGRQPLDRRVRARGRPHEHGRGLLRQPQARAQRELPPRLAAPPSPLPVGV